MINILVLCTGNSARSIMLESILRHYAHDRVLAHSAGSHPTGDVNPLALQLLQSKGHDTRLLRSKSWDEYALAPEMDMVITVCGNAARETCPVWPGSPLRAHWGIDSPSDPNIPEESRPQAFDMTYHALLHRAKALLDLKLEEMSAGELQHALCDIGKT